MLLIIFFPFQTSGQVWHVGGASDMESRLEKIFPAVAFWNFGKRERFQSVIFFKTNHINIEYI